MLRFYSLIYVPPFAAAVALGFIVAIIARRRSSTPITRKTRLLVAIGSAAGALVATAPAVLGIVAITLNSLEVQNLVWALMDSRYRFATPLVAGLVALALMSFVPVKSSDQVGADLTRRSTFAFAPRRLLITIGFAAAITVAISIAAGLASEPDDQGRYFIHWIDSGVMKGGTSIYGWYYSVPAMVLLVVLLGFTAFSLWRVSRPPLGIDTAAENAKRKLISTFIAATTLGAVLLHLSDISTSLRATAGIKVSAAGTATGEMFHTWSTFAALAPALGFAAFACGIAGAATWAYVFWRSVLGSKKRV